MDIRVLGCYGGESRGQHSAGFLINGKILLEAGSVTSALADDEQLAISHILVSHAHLDHTKELIFLVDNFFIHDVHNVRLMGIPDVMDQMSKHLFNDQLWPDFTKIPAGGDPILTIDRLSEDKENKVNDLTVVPVRVNHTVPASGFILKSGGSALVYTGDTGPTDNIWRRAGKLPELKAVFIECSFPDERLALAQESGHLTPSLLHGELKKLGRPDIPVYITHIKPAFVEQVTSQLASLQGFLLAPLTQGRTYSF